MIESELQMIYNELNSRKENRTSWLLLTKRKNGNDEYVIADKVLDCQPYNTDYTDVTWENSTLRNWLNTEFYNETFTAGEQKGIIKSRYVNEDNPWYGTNGGSDTEDCVTMLSLSDIVNKEYGFSTDYSCEHPSRIAYDGDDYSESRYGSYWWLRSSGTDSNYASFVLDDDYVHPYGYRVYYDFGGVRPALHFNLSSFSLKKKGTVTAEAGVSDEKKDSLTIVNIKNKKTCKTSKKVTIKDSDGIRQVKLNSRAIKVNGKKSFSFKLSKYKKYLKKAGSWNKLVITDKTGKKKTIKFKTK